MKSILYRAAFYFCLITIMLSGFKGITYAQTSTAVKLIGIDENTQKAEQSSTHSFSVILQNIGVQKKSNVRLRAYVNGGDMAELTTASLLPGENQITLNYTLLNSSYNGIGEVVIDSLGAFPIIINKNQKEVTVQVSKENLIQYNPPTGNTEMQALQLFLKIYRGYEKMFGYHYDILVSPWKKFSSDTVAFNSFLKDYISFRKQFNLFFEYAKSEFPGTYITEHLSSMFVQPQFTGFDQARDIYFANWNFGDSTLLNNPLFNRQLDFFRFISGIPSVSDDIKTTDALYGYAKKDNWNSKLVVNHINEYWLVNLFKENTGGEKDNTVEYLYRRWLSSDLETCSEDINSDTKFRNAFYKRMANIGKMRIGMSLPEVSGYTNDQRKIMLRQELSKKKYTILFLWSSSCSHCEEYTPLLMEFAKKHNDKLQVVAYSVDKKNTEEGWMKKIQQRNNISNWTDIAELSDMSSAGISNIFYMGTPSVFLLDQKGFILSKEIDQQTLEKRISQ